MSNPSIKGVRLPDGLRRQGAIAATAATALITLGLALSPAARAAGWELQSTPNAYADTQLNAVSCASSTSCTAAGETDFALGIDEAWNGTSWNLAFGQTLSGNANHSFTSISCGDELRSGRLLHKRRRS